MNPDFTVFPGWMPEFGIPGSPLELNVIAFQTGECVFFAACRERWVSFLSFVPIGEAKWTERSRPLSSRHFGACREADKIQEFAGKTQTQNTFFHIFNHLHQSNKQLVLTCDRPPVELVGMVSRLLTRFKWGLTAEVERPDYKLRYDILMSKVHRDGLTIDESVIDYIARNVTDNVRDLEGVIVSLMVRSSVLKKEISIEMADQVLAASVKMVQKQITIDTIKEAVCGYYGLDTSRLLERTRKREVVVARQMSMYLAKKYTSLSLAGIGDVLGKKDHATVLHACKTITEQIGVDKKLRSDLEEIEQRIQG